MESKPGIHTTEWWASVVASVLLWASHAAQSGELPLKYVAVLQAAVGVGYAISRGLAKLGQPYIPEGDLAGSVDGGGDELTSG